MRQYGGALGLHQYHIPAEGRPNLFKALLAPSTLLAVGDGGKLALMLDAQQVLGGLRAKCGTGPFGPAPLRLGLRRGGVEACSALLCNHGFYCDVLLQVLVEQWSAGHRRGAVANRLPRLLVGHPVVSVKPVAELLGVSLRAAIEWHLFNWNGRVPGPCG